MSHENHPLPRVRPYLLLDAWRGIAALWVVMVHSCLAYVSSGHSEALANPVYAFSMWGQLGVVFFFVISGYCIFGAAYSCIAAGKSVGRFLADRARRIYPPYLAALALALAVSALTAALQRWHVLPASSTAAQVLPFSDALFWLTNLTLLHSPSGPPLLLLVAWSLCYEIAFYGIVGGFLGLSGWLAGRGKSTRRAELLVGGGVLLTVVSLAWLLISPSTCPFPLDRWYQFGFGALLFGIVAQGGKRSSAGLKFAALGCVVLSLLYAVFSASAHDALGQPPARVQAIVCVLFFAVLLVMLPLNERISRWKAVLPLTALGTFSYSVYLVHLTFLSFADAGLRKVGFVGPLYMVTYLAQIVTAIVAGWIFFVCVERRFISKRQEVRIDAELRSPVVPSPRMTPAAGQVEVG